MYTLHNRTKSPQGKYCMDGWGMMENAATSIEEKNKIIEHCNRGEFEREGTCTTILPFLLNFYKTFYPRPRGAIPPGFITSRMTDSDVLDDSEDSATWPNQGLRNSQSTVYIVLNAV
jgi:hypothetical protein